MNNFNDNHPELREGEKWMYNHPCRTGYSSEREEYLQYTPEQMKELTKKSGNYKSVRIGHAAYDTSGNIIPGYVPIFVVPIEDV